MSTNDMSQYYVQNEIGVVTVQLVPCLPRIVLVPEELPVLQCTTTRSSWQSLPSTELLDSLSDILLHFLLLPRGVCVISKPVCWIRRILSFSLPFSESLKCLKSFFTFSCWISQV